MTISIAFAAFYVETSYREEGPYMIGLFSTLEKANTAARKRMEEAMLAAGEGATVALQGVNEGGFQSWEMSMDNMVSHESFTVAIPVQ